MVGERIQTPDPCERCDPIQPRRTSKIRQACASLIFCSYLTDDQVLGSVSMVRSFLDEKKGAVGPFLVYILLFVFLAVNKAIGKSSDDCTDNRSYPKEPKLFECPIADKQSWTKTAGWINRRVGNRNADEMDQC